MAFSIPFMFVLAYCNCNNKFFWHFTKELVWNKPAIEEFAAKINW